jgi:hypothetical protein
MPRSENVTQKKLSAEVEGVKPILWVFEKVPDRE